MTRFSLGWVLITPGALWALTDAGQTAEEFLVRHASGDYGELDGDGIEENEDAIAHGRRILSEYRTTVGQRLWVITEADRSSTTVLRPIEY